MGDVKNLIRAVVLSEVMIVKRAESVPAVIVMVADSLTVIVTAFVEVEVFSANEKVVELVNVGAVVSLFEYVKVKAIS